MNSKRLTIHLVLLAAMGLLVFGPETSAQTIWYVNASQTTYTPPVTGYGQSFEKAFPYLQDALTAAQSGDTVRIAQGWYFPDNDDDYPSSTHVPDLQTHSFVMKDDVLILGGWEGTGNPGNWDPEIYVTHLSGDIDGHNDNDNDPLTQSARTQNSFIVVRGGESGFPVDDTAVLEGCVVRDGHDEWIAARGAGLFVPGNEDQSTPRIKNCVFTRNLTGGAGGGAFVDFASEGSELEIWFENCRFIANQSGSGGGLAGEHNSILLVTDSEFREPESLAVSGH